MFDPFWDDLYICKQLAKLEVGPFDGGCLVIATAIRKAFYSRGHTAGPLYVLIDKRGGWHHAVYQQNGMFYDANGESTRDQLIAHWRAEEGVEVVDILPCEIAECLAHDCGCWDHGIAINIANYLTQVTK